MLGKLSWQSKFFFPLTILVFIILYLGIKLIFAHHHQHTVLRKLSQHLFKAYQLTNLLHEIQKETTLSVLYTTYTNTKSLRCRLRKQQNKTNQLFHTLNDKDKIFLDSLFTQLEVLRQRIDSGRDTGGTILQEYNQLTYQILKRISQITVPNGLLVLNQKYLAYTHLLFYKEYRSIEQSLLASVIANKHIDTKTLLRLNRTVTTAATHQNLFKLYAPKGLYQTFEDEILKNKTYQTIKKIRQAIYEQKSIKLRNFNVPMWFFTHIDAIDPMQTFLLRLEKSLHHDITQRLKNNEHDFIIIVIVTLISLYTFFLMILAFLRLYREEKKYRIIFEKYIISSVTDRKGRILQVSQAFCHISGYTKEELIGKPHNIVRHPDMPKETFADMWNTIKQGKVWSGKLKNRRKDGTSYWVYTHIEPLFDDNGYIDSYIAVRIDITQNEMLQEKIQKKEQEKKAMYELMLYQSRLAQMGEILSMIAHQWRQPLHSISIKNNVLRLKIQRGTINDSEQTVLDTIKSIDQIIAHLDQTINDFRNFFKPHKEKQMTSFTRIMATIRTILGKTLEEKGIVFDVHIINDSEFLCYENELKHVLLNLIKNASDAIESNAIQNGKITVKIEDFVIQVSDNAGGISEEILPKIFDPYFSTKTQKDGTGLGLYMSKLIIEKHCQGKIKVQNERNGASFLIDLSHLRPEY